MFENTGAGRLFRKWAVRADFAVSDDDQFAGFDRAFVFGTDHIECHRFRSKNNKIAQTAHDQRTNAQRIAARDHAFVGHAD